MLPFSDVGHAGRGVGRNSLPELVKKVRPAVVTVVAYNPAKAMPSLGSGFFVAPERIVSARHVLTAANRAEVRTATGVTLRVTGILAEDRPRDLVLMQIEKPSTATATLDVAAQQSEPGEKVFTIAAPLGFEGSVSAGVVSACRDVPDSGLLMQHTVQVSIGSSGGAILNYRGEVVAVQTGMMTEGKRTISAGQGLNFAVVARYVAALKPGKLRPLADAAADLPAEWLPPITANIGKLSLYSLTTSASGFAGVFRGGDPPPAARARHVVPPGPVPGEERHVGQGPAELPEGPFALRRFRPALSYLGASTTARASTRRPWPCCGGPSRPTTSSPTRTAAWPSPSTTWQSIRKRRPPPNGR